MCVYTYICGHIHTNICIYIVNICIYKNMYTYMCIHIHTYVCIPIYTRIHGQLFSHTHLHQGSCGYICGNMHMAHRYAGTSSAGSEVGHGEVFLGARSAAGGVLLMG